MAMAQARRRHYPFRVEVWDQPDDHVAELLALARNLMIAQAAYRQALGERPGVTVRLRNKARLVEEFMPQG